ncbi:hypothetical protein PVAND_001280 [Polypedilum vanderplanki]|uniref:Gelsolin-like domain-containing protein n=1 Tax=Polypedilum vanderplanki TaxID=319348 RepID=A0A9J6BMG0_POLVA|nr:hypothetical protein PVAND_001280 [Polypedilum vanderplanki]
MWKLLLTILSLHKFINCQEFNISHLHKTRPKDYSFSFIPDNGEGETEIFRFINSNMFSVELKDYGVFDGGDSYVVKYKYKDKNYKDSYIIYSWKGINSNRFEKVGAIFFSVKMKNDLTKRKFIMAGLPTKLSNDTEDIFVKQIQIDQSCETPHFLKIFKGKTLFTGIFNQDSYDIDGIRLFRIRGTNEGNVRTTQVEKIAKSLASDDVFILDTPANTFVWYGDGANDFEYSTGLLMSKRFSQDRNAIVIYEGEEPDEFWNALGGKDDYDHEIDPSSSSFEIRFFKCTRFITHLGETFIFDDLDSFSDEILVIDDGNENVYFYIGEKTHEIQIKQCFIETKAYIETEPTGRFKNLEPIILQRGNVTKAFKRLFSCNDIFWDLRH